MQPIFHGFYLEFSSSQVNYLIHYIIEFIIPQSLKAEHEELHNMLKQATQFSAKTGDATRTVAKLMHPHFVKEEEYALPPLGLLPLLFSGKFSEEMKQVLPMTDKLKKEPLRKNVISPKRARTIAAEFVNACFIFA